MVHEKLLCYKALQLQTLNFHEFCKKKKNISFYYQICYLIVSACFLER